MKKKILPLVFFMLLCIFTIKTVSNTYVLSKSEHIEKYEQLNDSCRFTFNYSDPSSLISQKVYSSDSGNIYITDVSDITENSVELTFSAEGFVTGDSCSFISASIPYTSPTETMKFLSSTIRVSPQGQFDGYYSFRTSELSAKGNVFSINIYRVNPSSPLDQQIEIELYPLYKASFKT